MERDDRGAPRISESVTRAERRIAAPILALPPATERTFPILNPVHIVRIKWV